MTLDHFRLTVIAYPDERIITGVELALHRLFEIDTSINWLGAFCGVKFGEQESILFKTTCWEGQPSNVHQPPDAA